MKKKVSEQYKFVAADRELLRLDKVYHAANGKDIVFIEEKTGSYTHLLYVISSALKTKLKALNLQELYPASKVLPEFRYVGSAQEGDVAGLAKLRSKKSMLLSSV